jgi:hypothetical protein
MCSRDVSQELKCAEGSVMLEQHEDELDYAVLDRVYGVAANRPARVREAAMNLSEGED